MRLFLDTEFNGFGGGLISLALVAEDGMEFYEVWNVPSNPYPWVAQHVLPYLAIDSNPVEVRGPSGDGSFHERLWRFIEQFPGCEIMADWPADFELLCSKLHYADRRASVDFTMRLTRVPGIKPEIPNNALSDARALKEAYLRNEQRNTYIATQMVELGDSVSTPNRAIYPLAI